MSVGEEHFGFVALDSGGRYIAMCTNRDCGWYGDPTMDKSVAQRQADEHTSPE